MSNIEANWWIPFLSLILLVFIKEDLIIDIICNIREVTMKEKLTVEWSKLRENWSFSRIYI